MSADRSAKAFPATWEGTCSDCGEWFDAGEDVGYVDGMLCCEICWLHSAPAEAAPVEDLVELPEPAPKPKRARKPAAKKLPAPRAKRAPVIPKEEETRPASELVGAGPARRMEERKAMLEDPDNDAAAMLFEAAGLLDDDGAAEVAARPEPEDMRLAAVDMLAVVVPPETVHRVEEPVPAEHMRSGLDTDCSHCDDGETSAIEDTNNAFGDLVESPAQSAAKYDHLPLNVSQWQEQAAALQAAGTAPQTEYRINGQLVTPQEWLDYQRQLQDWHAHAEAGQQLNYETAEPDPFEETPPAAAAAYRVCEHGQITQQPAPACDCAPPEEPGLLSQIVADIEQSDEPAGPHGLTFKELAQLSDTEDALQATPARYAGPLARWQVEEQLDHLEGILLHAIEHHPRSQQKRIGPSELGTPCEHCLAAKLAEWEETRSGGSWLPTIGTAVHTWIETQLLEHMRRGLDTGRYLAEHKVVTGAVQGKLIPGSTDVFDVVAGMTVDWKVVGATTLKAARRGPSLVYRRQQHLYAKGWRDMGAQVDWVAIEYLPRNAQSLKERIRWVEPYSEAEAVAALERADKLQAMLDNLLAVAGASGRDAFISMLPRDPDCHDCARFPDYPAKPLDATGGGLIDLGEVE